MVIPAQVINAASELIKSYGNHVEHLGDFNGVQAFYYHYPHDVTAGACPVYLFDGTSVDEVTDDVALSIIQSFLENVNVVAVE